MKSLRLICIAARPKFLPGSVILAFLGSAIAWRDGFFNAWVACLALCALLLWHISVNLLNDYFDYQSGIDLRTQRTVFSGGSGTLPSRQLSADLVLRFGLLTFALAIPLWVYLAIAKGWPLVPLLLIEGLIVLLYTPVLAKWGLGEVASSLGLGVLSLLVFYFVQSGSYALDMVAPVVASGILLFNLHLLNEFPDVEADRAGGRRTVPILLGRTTAGWIYLGGTVAAYGWIALSVVLGAMPAAALLSVLTLPLAVMAVKGALDYRDHRSFSSTLWASAAAYFLTLLLLGSGYVVDGL
jgi:1,4-dihydroxy-2-naphthoate octaprenyltransferase